MDPRNADAAAEKEKNARRNMTTRFPGVDFDGWTVEVRFRKSKSGSYVHYCPPGSSRKLRSLNEVDDFLFPASARAECSTMVLGNEDEELEDEEIEESDDEESFIVPDEVTVDEATINLVRSLGKEIAKRKRGDRCVEFWTEFTYKAFIVYYRGELETFEFRGHKFRVYVAENSLWMREVENNGRDWRLPLDTFSDGRSVRISTHERRVIYAMEDCELPLNITEHDLLVAFGYMDEEGRALEWHVTAAIVIDYDDNDRPVNVDRPVILLLNYFYTFANSEEEVAAEKEMKDAAEEDDAVCELCRDGGEVLICDGCEGYYHGGCVGLSDVPEGEWLCPWCLEQRPNKREVIDLTGDA
jgi:hypothetical protein